MVVDLGFLGDTVHLVPALWELRDNYPAAELHVLTSPVGAEVLQLVPCVRRAWAIEMNPQRRTLSQQWTVLRAVRQEKFDVAFNFSGADRAIFMLALTGSRHRVAQRGNRWHFYNPWLVPCWVPKQDLNLIVLEQRRRTLAACGLNLGPPHFDLQLDAASSQWAETLAPSFAMHISVNSSKATREWPLEHHVTMLRSLWQTHPELQVLVSGTAQPRERERLQQLAGLLNDSRLQVLPPNLAIPQLAALLVRCRLHLGPDSGMLHLAVALGVPTVSFFREQGAYKSFMPVGPAHKTISVPCHCIDNKSAPCEQLGYSECFSTIAPERVAHLVREQLNTAAFAAPAVPRPQKE